MPAEKVFPRLIEALAWRRNRTLLPLRRWLALRGSAGLVRWRWPWPLKKPWQRSRLLLTSHGGGIGDELMCTPIFREIRRRNPGCRITFLSRYPEIFRDNPHLDEVVRFSLSAASSATYLQYNLIVPPPRPLVTLMAECVGLVLPPSRLEPPLVEPSAGLRSRLDQTREPRIVIQPQASQWTPNKQWPVELWTQLVTRLVEHYDVVEVGTQTMFPSNQFGPRFHSLAGGSTMQDFAWIVSQATVFVGPPSGGMHMANAYEIPSVILLGGYESPDGYDYPWAARFFTPVECAPCWLTTPCPYELKCLRAIRPEDVFRAVMKAVPGARSAATGLRRMTPPTAIFQDLVPTPAAYLRAARRVEAGEAPDLRALRVAVLSTVSAQLLQPFLVVEGARRGLRLALSFAPFGQLEQPVLDAGSSLYAGNPEAIVILARLEELAPALFERFDLEPAEFAMLVEGVAARCRALLQGLRERTAAAILFANFAPTEHRVAGIGEAMLEASPTAAVAQANALLAAACRAVPGAYVFDYSRVVVEHGLRAWHDARLLALARQPWSVAAQIALAAALARTLRAAFVPPAKCLAVDADNTLWGGVIGEDGLGGIALGTAYPGNVFQEFQKYLRALKERGVLLALVSKNEAADVLAVLGQHADCVLRASDFAVCRINWEEKSVNLRAVATALNVGLDAVVFFDDSPFEREEVRRALPEVHVLEVPSDPLEYIPTLEASGVFDQLTFSPEDRQRGGHYRQQIARAEASGAASSPGEFLAGLEMVATIGAVGPDTFPRVAQLLAKTNQFNLTTRRHTAAQLAQMIAEGAVALWLRLTDRFGDYGLVGAAIARPEGAEWTVDTLLLSCRVLGRGAETALLAQLAAAVRARGGTELVGEFLPTPRNGQVAEFYPRHGFTPCSANRWRKRLSETFSAPSYIRIQLHE